jgi:ribonuclease BN (tRNA processing enzyme)
MEVTLLGTASALPSPDRLQSGTLIDWEQGRLLVDCGSGVTHRLAQAGIDIETVDTVLLTHHHLDHVADLPTLAKARWLQGHERFRIAGPPGTRDVCDSLFAVDDLDHELHLEVTEHTPADGPLSFGGHQIEFVETTHSKQCFAYRFGDALVLSGDTSPEEAVFELADGVDVLVHECGYLDDPPGGHTAATDLTERLQSIDVDRVVLTHLFPSAAAQAEQVRSTVAERVDASVTIGTDLSTIF